MKENKFYSSFNVLDDLGLINGITNKNVGINYSIQSRDEIRSKVTDAMGISYEFKKIITPRQTHTNNVVVINEDNLDSELQDIDGCVTNIKGVALTIATADCQSIMIYDKEKEVIANIHSGWKGTLNKILRNGINVMIDKYESNPKDLVICIGPSILKCCFEVDKDVVDMFLKEFTNIEDTISLGDIKNGKQKYYIDTIEINRRELIGLGVDSNNIICSNICTMCSSDIYHSYRVHGMDSGRNVSLICMK